MTIEEFKSFREMVIKKIAISLVAAGAISTEEKRNQVEEMIAAGPEVYWDQDCKDINLYCRTMVVEFGKGVVFTNCRYNGKPVDLMKMVPAFYLDKIPVVLSSNEGNIVCVHGCQNGDIFIQGKQVPLRDLEKWLVKGNYFLVSCYNANKRPEDLDYLASKGINLIVVAATQTMTYLPVDIDGTLYAYGSSWEDEILLNSLIVQMTSRPQ